MKFAIQSLPRSQSFWASQVLTTFDSVCLHEPFAKGKMESMNFYEVKDSIESLSEKNVGFAENIFGDDDFSGYRKVVIMRPVDDVVQSLIKIGFSPECEEVVNVMNQMLEERANESGVLVLDFPVANEKEIIKLFQHCLGRKPTGSELRKAACKIFLPSWYVDKAVKLSETGKW